MLTLLPFSCAQVSDFGLARLIALQGRITTDTYGTVTHMPPELLTGGDLSPAVVRIISASAMFLLLLWPTVMTTVLCACAVRSTAMLLLLLLGSFRCCRRHFPRRSMLALSISPSRLFDQMGCVQQNHARLSPNAMRCDAMSPQDVYSFGVLLWEMCCGTRAWAGLSTAQVTSQPCSLGHLLPMLCRLTAAQHTVCKSHSLTVASDDGCL